MATGTSRLAAVLNDAEAVFGYSDLETYQDRAHAYIERRGVARQAGDTAVLACVSDLVARASRCQPTPPSEEARAALSGAPTPSGSSPPGASACAIWGTWDTC